jgi:hypothetical protein
MRIRLVTFSDGSHALRAAGRRLVREADSTGWFDHPSEHWTLETLRTKVPDFYFKHHKFMRDHRKGFGYWIWKPAILSYLFDHLEDDEIVLYLDAGCQLNSIEDSKLRFQQYIEICRARDLLVVQLPDDLPDAAWTKRSTLDALDPDKAFRNTGQIQSTLVFAIKSEKSQRVVEKWLTNCVDSNYSLVLDPSDDDFQNTGFKDHRHDQSILSLIVKSEGIVPIKDETWFSPNWENGLNFPIWAMRNRTGGDFFRRNLLDLVKIFLAKLEHKLIRFFKDKH